MSFVRSDDWAAKRHLQPPFKAAAAVNGTTSDRDGKVPTLGNLCLSSLESSLGKGVATSQLDDLPFGIAEKIYEFVSTRGSRMARMEILRALAPILRQYVNSLDFSGAKVSFDYGTAVVYETSKCPKVFFQFILSVGPYVGVQKDSIV